MSHISTYGQKIKDVAKFCETCRQLGYTVREGNLTVKQFGSNAIRSIASVKLPGWRYEIAITADGTIRYDHWGAEANSFDRLGESIQAYNEATIKDHIPYDEVESWNVEVNDNGDRKIVLEYA